MKNQSYQNMSIKNVFLNENRICKDSADLDKEKWLWKSEICYILPSIPNRTKYLEPFMAVFIDL